MSGRYVGFLLVGVLGCAGACSSYAQGTPSPCPTQVLRSTTGAVVPTKSPDLVCVIPQIYGVGGLVGQDYGGPLIPTSSHSVHFQASSLQSFPPLNEEIGVQLSQLPIAAPVAGYLFANGAVSSTTESLGPILMDRADTLGRKRVYLGVSYQHFDFDGIGDVNLKSFGTVFTHEPEACDPSVLPPTDDKGEETACVNGSPRYTHDIIATKNRLTLKLNQVTLVSTFGVTDDLDVSALVPILGVKLTLNSSTTIINLPTTNPGCSQEHRFADQTDASSCLKKDFSVVNSAAGIGDVILRAKYRVFHGERSSFATGVEFRIPTGDAMNLLGAGTWGVRAFENYSAQIGRLSVQGSGGFQGNGQSVLAGDVTGAVIEKAHLPDVISYSAGADFKLHRRVGLSSAYLGQTLLHGTQVTPATYAGYTDPNYSGPEYTIGKQPTIGTNIATINLGSVAAGVKFNPFSNLLITANGLFRINNAGLHAKPAPLIGVAYYF